MKAVDFDYACPASVGEACELLRTSAGEARIIAGGQTLVPLLAMRLARPALLVDINRIAELQGIAADDGQVTVRSCTRQAAALADAAIRRRLPLLAKALGFVGHGQTRNRGTIGGSLANADPAAEICLVARTLDADIDAGSAAGSRTIAAGEFFTGAMTTALGADECLTSVRFPRWREARIGTGFQETSARRSDFALAAVAAQLALDVDGACCRLALGIGGAAATPLRIQAAEDRLLGSRLEAGDIAAAAAIVGDAVDPPSDLHGSARYRRRLIGALVERALTEARQEARAAGA
jgi:CO/xanthine dehydrogenase FAD-binding subunit